jgi:hypothetical protein
MDERQQTVNSIGESLMAIAQAIETGLFQVTDSIRLWPSLESEEDREGKRLILQRKRYFFWSLSKGRV